MAAEPGTGVAVVAVREVYTRTGGIVGEEVVHAMIEGSPFGNVGELMQVSVKEDGEGKRHAAKPQRLIFSHLDPKPTCNGSSPSPSCHHRKGRCHCRESPWPLYAISGDQTAAGMGMTAELCT